MDRIEQLSLIKKEIDLDFASKIMSYHAFFHIVVKHLKCNIPMSIVRMADGEKMILDIYHKQKKKNMSIKELMSIFTEEEWEVRMGMVNATVEDIVKGLYEAESLATYFAPSVSGLYLDIYKVKEYFPPRNFYIDVFWHNDFKPHQIKEIYELGNKITVIHSDKNLKEILKNKSNDKYTFNYVHLSNWDQADTVIEEVGKSDSKLILVSGSKRIGPNLATRYDKICLDIGNTMDYWLSCI